MTLKSMTGFARTDGVHKETSWHWEVRSVNGRSLELRLRLPSGFETLEVGVRGLCQEKLACGNVSITFSLKRETGQTQIRLNEAVLGQALAVARTPGPRHPFSGSMYGSRSARIARPSRH